MPAFGPRLSISVVACAVACGTAPPPRDEAVVARPAPISLPAPPTADPCQPFDGKAPPALGKTYTGLAAKARCEPELQAIMREASLALGVGCAYCHEASDFAAMTPKKLVANWMATEFVPSLKKRDGGSIACRDCHAGRAKLLGNPRRRDLAIEWMTIGLGEHFDEAGGRPLYCKTCHAADLGSPAFVSRVILTDRLPAKLPPP